MDFESYFFDENHEDKIKNLEDKNKLLRYELLKTNEESDKLILCLDRKISEKNQRYRKLQKENEELLKENTLLKKKIRELEQVENKEENKSKFGLIDSFFC